MFGVSAKLEVVGLYKTEKRALDRFTPDFDFRCVIKTLPCKAKNATYLLFKVRVRRKCHVRLLNSQSGVTLREWLMILAINKISFFFYFF